MKKVYSFLLITACLAVALMPGISAGAEGRLPALVDGGAALLFGTPNVTVTGKAEFRYDGARFKTVEIRYVQDGTNSFWQEKLLTPRVYRPDRETGFTVISNHGTYYLMEPYTSGAYRQGYDDPQNTIIRESFESRLLVSFLKTAATLTEPEMAQYITTDEDGWTLTLAEHQTPELLNEALLMGGRFIAKRLFNIDYDVSLDDRSDWSYATTAREILFTTERCGINSASIRVGFDAQGRLSALSGRASIRLDFAEQEYGGQQTHTLDTDFELHIGEYGTSEVKPFDPDEYQVVPWKQAVPQKHEADEKTAEEMTQRALECWKAACFENADRFSLDGFDFSDGVYYLRFSDPGDDSAKWGYSTEITENGGALYMSTVPWQRYEDWLEHEQPADKELTDEMLSRVTDFLSQVNPDVKFGKLTVIGQYVYGDTVFLDLADENWENEYLPLLLTVQYSPEWKIVHYTCIGNG